MQIASFLAAKGCSVSVLSTFYALENNENWVARDLADVVTCAMKESQPRVVGVSNIATHDHPECLQILEICKNVDETVVTVIGGPHVTFLDLACLQQSPFVDVVVRGGGEWTMLDLRSALKTGRDLGSVIGITFRHNNQVIRNPARLPGDLKELPPIDFRMLPSQFVKNADIFGVASQGCAYRCTYCVESVFWGKRREHSVDALMHEIMTLNRDYGRCLDGFMESMIDPKSGHFFELTEELVKNKVVLPADFVLHMRPDYITDSAIEAMVKAGISCVRLGVESGSTTVRKRMGRFMPILLFQTIPPQEDHIGISLRILGQNHFTMLTSRGCNCTFCISGNFGNRYHSKKRKTASSFMPNGLRRDVCPPSNCRTLKKPGHRLNDPVSGELAARLRACEVLHPDDDGRDLAYLDAAGMVKHPLRIFDLDFEALQ